MTMRQVSFSDDVEIQVYDISDDELESRKHNWGNIMERIPLNHNQYRMELDYDKIKTERKQHLLRYAYIAWFICFIVLLFIALFKTMMHYLVNAGE